MIIQEAIKKYDRIHLPRYGTPDWYIGKTNSREWGIYDVQTGNLLESGRISLSKSQVESDKWEEYPKPTSLKQKVITKLEDFEDNFPGFATAIRTLIKEIESLDWENENEQ